VSHRPDSGVARQTVRDVCEDLSEFVVKVLHCDWLPDPEDEGTTVLRNVGKYTAIYRKRCAWALWITDLMELPVISESQQAATTCHRLLHYAVQMYLCSGNSLETNLNHNYT